MNKEESTYALLIRSEEKGRGLFEAIAYLILVLSAVFSIWQFAQHPVRVPAAGLQSSDVACSMQCERAVSQS